MIHMNHIHVLLDILRAMLFQEKLHDQGKSAMKGDYRREAAREREKTETSSFRQKHTLIYMGKKLLQSKSFSVSTGFRHLCDQRRTS